MCVMLEEITNSVFFFLIFALCIKSSESSRGTVVLQPLSESEILGPATTEYKLIKKS